MCNSLQWHSIFQGIHTFVGLRQVPSPFQPHNSATPGPCSINSLISLPCVDLQQAGNQAQETVKGSKYSCLSMQRELCDRGGLFAPHRPRQQQLHGRIIQPSLRISPRRVRSQTKHGVYARQNSHSKMTQIQLSWLNAQPNAN